MLKVLVISTADLRVDLGRTVLWRGDVEHAFAHDGATGLRTARSFEPTLVVVDGALPEATGILRLLRNDPATRRTAITVVSRDPWLADAPLLRGAGATAVVPSPTNPAVWDARLEELLTVPRRREGRLPMHVAAWSRGAERGDFVLGRALNISVKGLLLEAGRRLEVGQKVDVRFLLPGSDEEFQAVGEVVRQGDGTRSGIRFVVLRGDARRAIEAFVEAGTAAAAVVLGTASRAALPTEIGEWEAALRKTETLKTTLLEISLDSIIVLTHEGVVLDVNRAAERTLGYRREQLLGKTIGETIAGPVDRDPHRQRLAHLLATGGAALVDQRLEMTVYQADGSAIPVELTLSSSSVDGKPVYAAFVRDLRAARKADLLQATVHAINETSSAEGDFNGLCAIIHGLVADLMHAAHFFIAVRNDSSERLSFAYFVDPAAGTPPGTEAMESLAGYVLRTGEPLLASPGVVTDLVSRGHMEKTGGPFVEWFGVPLKKHGQPFGVVAVQSTDPAVRFSEDDRRVLTIVAPAIAVALERKEAESRIHYLAYHDALTGLANRDLLLDRIQLAIAQAARDRTRLAVFFLDLDRFKAVNDSLGHTAGDQLLKEAASRLDQCVRKGDTLARIDGDTFTVVVRGIHEPADAAKVAQILRSALAEPMTIGEREVFVTASIGISVFPEDGSDVETLMKNADTALHRAKEIGHDSFRMYDPSMNAQALQRLRLEHSLRRALSRGELVTYYQPVVDLATGEIHGVEALLRWRHAERGLLLPGEFLQLAEATGMIRAIGSWGLKAACLQVRAWQEQAHPGLSVAVNLSARQLQQMDLVAEVTRALEESQLPAACLELEVTETSARHDVEATIRVLEALKELGVRISMDDFGIGYSSLGQLQRLPIDTLKIDQSFVRNITADRHAAAIAAAIIHLGHTLGMTIVAEGVETDRQLAVLAEQRCDRIQGFYISRALPTEQCAALLVAHDPAKWRCVSLS